MISTDIKKRIITSILLIILLIFMFLYSYILVISLIVIALISWIEFYGLTVKIFHKSNLLKFICKSFSLMYLMLLVSGILYIFSTKPELKLFLVYSVLVAIASDIGGLTFGKLFKGKKLSKISPKKTISGSIGSFVFSLLLIPIFVNLINHETLSLLVITLLISFTTQLGDLFISFLKRKAKVKDTSDLLPGHGGILDRIDGIIFALPIGYLFLNYF
jgi:phosphatidate cytidylyltransferase